MAIQSQTLVNDLVDEARSAEDIAAAFFPFLDNIQQASAEISGVMSELLAISSQLRALSSGLSARRFRSRIRLVLGDLQLTLASLSFTLKDMDKSFERLAITGRSAQAYLRVWREIGQWVSQEGSGTLLNRLETYRTFLVELVIRLEGSLPGPYDVPLLRQRIETTLAIQEGSPVNAFGNLSLGGPDALIEPVPPPQGPPVRRRSRRSATPPAPEMGVGSRPPRVPEPPPISRPDTRGSSPSSSSRWALNIFDARHSITPFSVAGQPSKCQGEHVDHAEERLSRVYDKLVEIDFHDGALIVQIYVNPRDGRTKILCLSGYDQPGSPKTQCTQSLHVLRIAREENTLLLYQVRTDGESRLRVPWTRLTFASYERLVLTFLLCAALKAQGPADSAATPSDFKLGGETELHAFKIEDDGYLHALRIFKDKHTKGVRLEASVLRGELKGMPVWTAFVSQYMGSSSGWAKRVRSKVVQLSELHPYIFSSSYTPPRGRTGHHELTFLTSRDALDFLAVVSG
ncbi:MAG: hypothetical protein M1837_006594 [Sclerophora amabilis]|nr:MAG: hypothetical protein M1837_006594 [Sclerophora amabilis]